MGDHQEVIVPQQSCDRQVGEVLQAQQQQNQNEHDPNGNGFTNGALPVAPSPVCCKSEKLVMERPFVTQDDSDGSGGESFDLLFSTKHFASLSSSEDSEDSANLIGAVATNRNESIDQFDLHLPDPNDALPTSASTFQWLNETTSMVGEDGDPSPGADALFFL